MARLNTALSPTPSGTRESSLYRDPTPYSPRRSTTFASTNYPVLSPTPTPSSDKENQSEAREPESARGRAKGMAPPNHHQPTVSDAARSKRRRLGDHDTSLLRQTPARTPAAEPEDLRYYDPDQKPEERRELRRDLRLNHRDFQDRRDELLAPDNNDLTEYINRSNSLMEKVRQTADATIDSRFLVAAGDLALKKTTQLVLGDSSTGIDLDEFVSKCITFMKNGGPLGVDEEDRFRSTQSRHRARTGAADYDDEDAEGDEGDALDWVTFGERACYPHNKRPAVPSFLLGPLSVQKRARAAITQRRQRLQATTRGPTNRPQSVEPEDLQRAENSNLTTLCKRIRTTLARHAEQASEAVEAELNEMDEDVTEEDFNAAMRRHRVTRDSTGQPSVSLFDFAVNPQSFGQTVENLFYISFLIREGSVAVDKDEHGLPTLRPSQSRTIEEQREQQVSKHQAVFSLDWPTWRQLIDAFDIKEPLIPHRAEEATQVNARGWYG